MSIFWIICLVIIITEEPTLGSSVIDKYTQITTNFFINLKHNYGGTENVTNKGRMMEEIQHFRNFINDYHKRQKRQLAYYHLENEMNTLRLEKDIQRFSGLTQSSTIIDIKNALDAAIFTQRPVAHDEANLYIATLQEVEYIGSMIIHKHNAKENKWEQLFSQDIKNPSKVTSVTFEKGTLLCVAHKSLYQNTLHEGITVLLLDDNIRLHFVQMLETSLYNNIALWQTNEQIFLTYSTDHIQNDNKVSYETTSPLYVWRGHHFNFLHFIPVSNAKYIVTFEIDMDNFLGVANYQNNYEETKIFSSIYKYNNHENKYINYQNLATTSAAYIISFNIRINNNNKNYFLLVVNEECTADTTQYEIISNTIIYKFENNCFVPFQNFFTKGKTTWYKLEDAADSFALLCVSESDGLKIFQYTGWKFTDVNPMKMELPTKYTFMKSSILNRKSILVAGVDESKTSISIYKPVFNVWNNVRPRKTSFYSWCEDMKKYISCLDSSQFSFKNIKNRKDNEMSYQKEIFSSKVGDKKLLKKLGLSGATIGKIKTKKIIADDVHLNINTAETLNNFQSLFLIHQSSIKFLQENIKNRLWKNNLTHEDTLHIVNLHMESDNELCQFDEVEVDTLNGFNVPIFQKEVLYRESMNDPYGVIEFDELTVENSIQFNTINNLFVEQLPLLEFVKGRGVHVEGNVYFPLGLSVGGTVDGTNISKTTILLSRGDQIFEGNFAISHINTVFIDAENINDLTKISLEEILSHQNKTYNSKYTTGKLISDEIFIEGLVNNISIKKIFEDSLKLSGNQEINGSFTVASLETVDISASETGPNLIHNIILIDEGEYIINQDVTFDNLTLNHLLIGQRLNNIPVIKNEIQVLMLEAERMQRVTGDKVFDFVELMGPFNLQGKINSPSLERKNPVTMIEKPLILTGNYIINGTVSVEKFLSCDDVSDVSMDSSMKQLQTKALRLDEKHIPMAVTFTQPLEIEYLETNIINGINPSSWVSASEKVVTIVTGKKTFLKNLHVHGNCSIHNLNTINLHNLDKSLLKTYGDQTVYGEISLTSVAADKIVAENVKLGDKEMNDIVMNNENIEIKGETIIHNEAVILHGLSVKYLDITGLISGHNINYILQDTVMLNSYPTHLYGIYNFVGPLYVRSLVSNKTFGLNTQPSHLTNLRNRHLTFSDLTIHKPALIKRIIFDSSINGLSKQDFGSNWLVTEGNQVIHSKQYFSKVYFTNDVHLQSGAVNNVNIQKLYRNVVWLYDNIHVTNALFNNGFLIKGNMNIEGLFNGLHLPENLILRSAIHGDQHITGHKTFNNINVVGITNVQLLNNVAIKSLCQFGDYSSTPNIIISGSLNLLNANTVEMLHGVNINYLLNHIWFSDTPCRLTGKNDFKFVNVQSDLQGNILVEDINPLNLTGKYLSLTEYQEVNTSNIKILNVIANIASVENGTAVSGNILDMNSLQHK